MDDYIVSLADSDADPDILGKCFLTYMNKTSIFRIHNSSGYLVILHKQNTSS